VTDGVHVRLDRLNRVLHVDRDGGLVTTEAGIRLDALIAALGLEGLALPIVGSITTQSLAGAIATGTHGSSLRHGNLSTLVTALRIVTGRGEVIDLGEGDERLEGARVALGALGVVTRITLRVVPRFQLAEETFSLPFDEGLRQLESLARGEEYVKLWWLPHTDRVQVFRYRRTEEATTIGWLGRFLDAWLVNRCLFPAMLWLGACRPGWIPRLNRLVGRAYLKPRRRVGPSDRMLSLAMPPRHREMEYAVPLARGADALRGLRALIEREGLRVNFVAEVRFVKGDRGWMSPAYGRDSCHIGAYMARSPDVARYFAGAAELLRDLGGRPHWGKELALTFGEARTLWPEAERFCELARALDPERRFRNALLDAVLESVEATTSREAASTG
jgi:L-gulonolactone oxidase